MKEARIQRSKTAKEQREEKQEGSKEGMDQSKLTNEWEAQRHGEINSGSQQTPCVRRGENEEERKEKAGQPESFASQPGEGGLPGQASQLTS